MILMKRIPGIRGESPESAGSSGDPPATPLGPPGDAPGTPGDLQGASWTTKTAISRQVYSARSSRLLRSNLLVGTHRPKESTGPFYL